MMPRPRREPTGLGLRPRAGGLGSRLRALLSRSSTAVEETWDELEEALIAADVGAETTLELVAATQRRVGVAASGDAVREALAEEIRARLEAVGCGRFEIGSFPAVIMVVGVNGSGKTTTIAKLAARFMHDGRSVVLAAGDTFRAAAVEQLRLWGERDRRAGRSQRPGRDPGAVAFDAMPAARVARDRRGHRRHRGAAADARRKLMAELTKIRRVIERRAPGQPRHVLLVLDATTGQNGLAQARGIRPRGGGDRDRADEARRHRQGGQWRWRSPIGSACRSSSPASVSRSTHSPRSTRKRTWSGCWRRERAQAP